MHQLYRTIRYVNDLITTTLNTPLTVYGRKGAYRFKTAFPEPYPLQKRSLSAKNKLSDRQCHQKVSKIISFINYMKKRAMQRYNREAMRQKSTATCSLMMQIFYNVTQSSLWWRPQTITQQRKQTFSNSLGYSRNCFLVFCKEFMWKMSYMHSTDRIIRYSLYKWHGKENNLTRDPICLWLRIPCG